jgi:hypothetical protein
MVSLPTGMSANPSGLFPVQFGNHRWAKLRASSAVMKFIALTCVSAFGCRGLYAHEIAAGLLLAIRGATQFE